MDLDTRKAFDELNSKIEANTQEISKTKIRLEALAGEMHQRFEAIDQRFEAIDQRFEAIDQRFEAIDQRFEAIDQRFEAIDQRFEAIDRRFDRLENRIDGLADEVARDLRGFLSVLFEEQASRLGIFRDKLNEHGSQIDDHEKRIKRLEKKRSA